MKVIRRISINADSSQQAILLQYGITVKEGFSTFEIEENTEVYRRLSPLFKKWSVVDLAGAIFTPEDINGASNLVFSNGCWMNGYPQPEKKFGYLDTTYDSSNRCPKCGTGSVQKESFILKKEPSWGRKKAFQLNWVFDEIFVTRKVYLELFKNWNIGYKDVLLEKTHRVIEDTVQLILPESASTLQMEEFPFETCSLCQD